MILIWLRSRKIFTWKNVSGGFFDTRINRFRKQASPFAISGSSDIIGLLPQGRFLAIEVKAPKGVVTPLQQDFIDKINNSGGLAFVARDLETVKEKLGDI